MDYKDTLNLPQTEFPMKANLAKKEIEILKKWEEINIYDQLENIKKGSETFILHDGPPYANGNIHSGHALNKILKDIILKSKCMTGYHTPYVPGWDCHGLPIEHQVDKKLGGKRNKLGVVEKRAKCRAYAEEYVNIQREEFKRIGIFGDWNNPYLTMSHEYEIGIVRELIKFVDNGSLYRDFKPVHWCPSCVTALAEAEVEYYDHTSPSIYVRFKLSSDAAAKLQLPVNSTYLVIWTTTPWTLPANLGVCLHPDFKYSAITAGDATYVLAEELVDSCVETFGFDAYQEIAKFNGSDFENMKAEHPWLNKESSLVLGEHVTLEQGTGCVHTAPGHGQEDYVVGLKYGLEVFNPVGPTGKFLPDVPHFANKKVWEANDSVIEVLQNSNDLLARENIEHPYPHCWRCRTPIIFRATAQWFISMEANNLRSRALETIRKVQWVPTWGEDRIYGMIENRPDWCISRQRVWGVPIVAFYCERCGETMFTLESANHVANILEAEGLDSWYSKPAEELVPSSSKCSKCGHDRFEKSKDILDVWFDSGASHAIVTNNDERLKWPADLYLEGTDQHRGWFHTSLLESIGTKGEAPYKEVLTHGYVVDGNGRKMSKSIGNVIAPKTIIDRFGAEILRLWVASEDYREDVRLSDEILKRLSDAYRKIRNTIRFLMGNTFDFDPIQDMVSFDQRMELDRVIIVRLHKLVQRVLDAYNNYEFHIFYHALHNFCVLDLSSFYLDIIKDRLYTYPKTSFARRSAQSSLYELTDGILRLMAPVLCFTAEEAWSMHTGSSKSRKSSVHLEEMPSSELVNQHEKLMRTWDRILVIRGEVSQALESARKEKFIGHSLDAKIQLSAFTDDSDILEDYLDDLPFLFIVSQVELLDEEQNGKAYISEKLPGLRISVFKADGDKCERCWNYSITVGTNDVHPTICGRCVDALEGM